MADDLNRNIVDRLPSNIIPLKRDHLKIEYKGEEKINAGLTIYLQSFHDGHYRTYTIKRTTNVEDIYPWIDGNKAWLLTGSKPKYEGPKI